jgi:hypothetical protein
MLLFKFISGRQFSSPKSPISCSCKPLCAISKMNIQLLIGLTIIFFSCHEKKADQPDKTDSLNVGDNSAKTDFEYKQDDCHVWLADTTLTTGEFIKYIKEDGKVKIEWGNKTFKRILKNDYDCEGAPSWVPTIRWSTSKYIGLKYGCGSPCWGSIILPINSKDSVIERMYDLQVDTLGNRVVYLDKETYDRLVVENFRTGQKINIDYGFECKAVFTGYCIDTLILNKDKLTIKWVDWTNDGQKKMIKTEEFKLDI